MKTDNLMDKNVVTMGDIVALKNWMESFLREELAKLLESPRPKYCTAKEAGRVMGITAQAIRKRLRDPDEKCLKGFQQKGVKTGWLVSVKSLEAWMESIENRAIKF